MFDKVTYFEKKGPENTEAALRAAVEAAKALGIGKIVMASNTGRTAKVLLEQVGCEGLDVTVIAYAYGQKERAITP